MLCSLQNLKQAPASQYLLWWGGVVYSADLVLVAVPLKHSWHAGLHQHRLLGVFGRLVQLGTLACRLCDGR